jgi:predicted nucleic acid-binding Zn ribbon protein
MIYQYKCAPCDVVIEKDYPLGKAEEAVKCDTCLGDCPRHYGEMNFVLKGGGWPGKAHSFNKEMTQRNVDAGNKQESVWRDTVPKLIDQR